MPLTFEEINKMKTPVLCEISWWFMGGTKPDAFVGGYKKLKD